MAANIEEVDPVKQSPKVTRPFWVLLILTAAVAVATGITNEHLAFLGIWSTPVLLGIGAVVQYLVGYMSGDPARTGGGTAAVLLTGKEREDFLKEAMLHLAASQNVNHSPQVANGPAPIEDLPNLQIDPSRYDEDGNFVLKVEPVVEENPNQGRLL